MEEQVLVLAPEHVEVGRAEYMYEGYRRKLCSVNAVDPDDARELPTPENSIVEVSERGDKARRATAGPFEVSLHLAIEVDDVGYLVKTTDYSLWACSCKSAHHAQFAGRAVASHVRVPLVFRTALGVFMSNEEQSARKLVVRNCPFVEIFVFHCVRTSSNGTVGSQ